MKHIFGFLAAVVFFSLGCGLCAQTVATEPTITMDQALKEAFASGDDFALVSQTLSVARLQRSLDLAKQGVSVSASGGYTLTDGLGSDTTSAQQSLLARAESASGSSATSTSAGILQAAQGSLSLSTPLTKLSLSVTHSIPVASSSASASLVGLTGSQTLWDGYPGGQFTATLEKSSLVLQSRESQAVAGYSAAAVKVKQAYITMLAAQRDSDIKKQVLKKQTNLLEQLQAVYALRQASEVDLKTAQINAKTAALDVATAEKTLSLANERLAAIIGRQGDGRFVVADIPDPMLPAASIDEAIQIGLSKRNDLAQYDISARSAKIDASLARAQGQPAVSLTGGAGIAVAWTAPPLIAEGVNIGAKIALPVMDSGASALQSKTSAGQADLYAMQAAQLRKTIASDIRDYFETVQLLASKVDLAKQSADLADLQFELIKTQNAYGTATTQDMLTASVTAATAEVNYGTVRNSYLLAELALETAMGL